VATARPSYRWPLDSRKTYWDAYGLVIGIVANQSGAFGLSERRPPSLSAAHYHFSFQRQFSLDANHR